VKRKNFTRSNRIYFLL